MAMDGTGGTTGKNRNTGTPGAMPPKPPAPTATTLYQTGFISEAQLHAEISKSKEKADAAYMEVCALVNFIDPSVTITRKNTSGADKNSSQTNPTSSFTPQEKSKRSEELLIENYQKKNYSFIKSKDSKNSLTASLLKLFSGDHNSAHQTKLNEYRTKLNSSLKAQKRTELNDKDPEKSEHLHDILDEMRKDKTLKYRNCTVEIWRANDKGEPIKFCIGSGTDRVILFEREGEFMAVMPPQKSPHHTDTLPSDFSDDDRSNTITNNNSNSNSDSDNDADNL
jgi:hypothetical protein